MNRRVKIYGGPADGQEYVTDAPYFEAPIHQRSRYYKPFDVLFDMEHSLNTVRYIVYPYGENKGVAFPSWCSVDKLGSSIAIGAQDLADERIVKLKLTRLYDEFWKVQDRDNCYILEQTVTNEQMRLSHTLQVRYSVCAWAIKLFPLPELATLGKRDNLRMWTTFGTKRITDQELRRTTVDAKPDPDPSTEVVHVGNERSTKSDSSSVRQSAGADESGLRLGGRAFGKSNEGRRFTTITES